MSKAKKNATYLLWDLATPSKPRFPVLFYPKLLPIYNCVIEDIIYHVLFTECFQNITWELVSADTTTSTNEVLVSGVSCEACQSPSNNEVKLMQCIETGNRIQILDF